MSAYQITADLTIFGMNATLSLTNNSGVSTGTISFFGDSLDLHKGLNDLVTEIQKVDSGFTSPFEGVNIPDLEFPNFDLESFDTDSNSNLVLKANGSVNGESFTVRYGYYAPTTQNEANPQLFSLQLSPFKIDTLPGVNIHLPTPITVDIQEIGVVTKDFIDENNNTVSSGFYLKGQLSIEGIDTFGIAYPASSGSQSPAPVDASSDVTGTDDAMIKWFNVNKSIGTARLRQLGLQWKDNKVWVLLNASISFGGIALDLIGLKAGVGIAFPPPVPVFGLDGLGLSFDEGGVIVAGSFDQVQSTIPGVTSEFDGAIEIKYGELTIEGIGSYAKINGHDSIFVYAFLDYPIGGPDFFFVEGLALGFGYNRQLIMPPLDQVQNFPLVAQALGNPSQYANDPVGMLTNELNSYIPPMEGELLLAVGIKFSTYEVLDSFLLLAVSFGEKTRFDIIGLSQLSLPPDDNEEPVVFVQIALEASFDPSSGVVEVNGMITDQSYVYSKDTHLSGGFAFYAWFKDQTENTARAGDFVVSLGGYNPNFQKPDYYPTVPRFALNWKVNSDLNVKADAYFALTPRYAMAGYQLKATFDDGSLSADFQEGADFLIQWKPFHYDITTYISIKASFTARIHLVFTTIHKTFHLDVGANLHLWGPQFSGHADIHVKVMGIGFSFSISFGAGAGKPASLSWTEFVDAFLPASNGISASASKGLAKTMTDPEDSSQKIWIFNPNDLTVEVNTIVPLNSVSIDGGTPQTFQGVNYGSGPMGLGSGDFSSNLDITVTNLDNTGGANEQIFKTTAINKEVPAALWDVPSENINADSTLPGVGGVDLSLFDSPTGGSSQEIETAYLEYETSKNPSTDWSYNDTNTDDFSYDQDLFTKYLPDYSIDQFEQLQGTNADDIAENLYTGQDLLAKPQVIDLMGQFS